MFKSLKKPATKTENFISFLVFIALIGWLSSGDPKPQPKKTVAKVELSAEEKEELAEEAALKAERNHLFNVRVKCASILTSKFKFHKVSWVGFKPLHLKKGIRQAYNVVNKKNNLRAVFTCQETAKTGRVSVRLQRL